MTHDCPDSSWRTLTRRLLMMALVALLLPSMTVRAANAEPTETSKIVTLDWTLAETLLALGVTPLGVAQIDAYHSWAGNRMPDAVTDIGLRAQPNLELLASLDPERILISPMFASLEPRLSHIAPVKTLGIYLAEGDTWSNMLAVTREMARLVDRPKAARQLIDATEEHLARLRRKLPEDVPPLLLVQFMDARHVRVSGAGSLHQAVFERLGLESAWTGPTNAWGFSLVGLEELAGIDAQLVVIKPMPTGVRQRLEASGLWQNLTAVRRHEVLYLPPVWGFGGLPSARRFADLLVEELIHDTDQASASAGESDHG
ncbi:iron complex transport system substrate-binding protein [Modicisalibacter muralis]|uniref:Iron complex transport system substrate-binding protein n=1 Tax=Modicisalibacter muralis TaxID=119000 RepID=A0A1G9ID25_9GAMM|nr:iron-siderophore ABC transporter substrate-binding protein [Halomonas muralis]SDL23022.1 iron complex transport system substrate-binding protein [Halomonas muralis]